MKFILINLLWIEILIIFSIFYKFYIFKNVFARKNYTPNYLHAIFFSFLSRHQHKKNIKMSLYFYKHPVINKCYSTARNNFLEVVYILIFSLSLFHEVLKKIYFKLKNFFQQNVRVAWFNWKKFAIFFVIFNVFFVNLFTAI